MIDSLQLGAPVRLFARLVEVLLLGSALASLPFAAARASDLTESILRVRPSVVGIGTHQPVRNPPTIFTGTGFAVADGRHVVTNAHVINRELKADARETLIVLVVGTEEPQQRSAQIVAIDRAHDIAVLKIDGTPLPPLAIADSGKAREGMTLAFTGFPIGMALGLHPATHRATLAAIVPIARAGVTAKQLNPRMVNRLRDSGYVVFQLDATAYPGNSGSPLFDPVSAQVYGVVNSVFIQGTREQIISRPSGITYAIPSSHIRDVLEQAKITPAP